MLKLLLCSICGLLWALPAVRGLPQDFQTGIIMAAAQAKEVIDNGAAARNEKSIEIFGAKFKNDMEVGFGDAIKHKRSTSDSDSSSESESDETVERRRKRSVGYDTLANDIHALYKNL